MQPGLPTTIVGKIEFFEQRAPDWAANAADIGLSAPQVADLIARTSAARAAYNAAQASRVQAQSDTAAQKQAVRDLAAFGGDLIATIRAFADLQPDPLAVYNEAELQQPAPKRTPLPPPVAATEVTATLQQSGAVKVGWKGTVANGTFYDVYRQLNGQSGFTQIGTSASRTYTDTTVPAGTTQASYYTIARRDELSSNQSQQAVIRFGMPSMQNSQPGGQSANGSLGLAA